MKKKVFILFCISIFFISCNKKNESQNQTIIQTDDVLTVNSSDNTIIFSNSTEKLVIKGDNNQVSTEDSKDNVNITNSELYNHHTEDPNYWTNEKQKEIYETLFEKQELEEVIEFRNFIESLAKYHHDDPIYEYNPIFLCYEKYPDNLGFFLEKKKELFLSGTINWGDYSESPFLYVVKNKTIDDIKFYFDNELPVLESKDELLYGSRNAGGPRFGIGGNILLYTDNEEIRNYLISKGVPSEIDAVSYFAYYLKKDNVEIYELPGFKNQVIATISKNDNFTALKVLTYKIDDEQWMKIAFNEIEGWIPQSSFDYDTGI